MTHDEFAELSAAAALGALSPDEQQAFDAALAEHPEWASLAAVDADTAAALAEGAPAVAPPSALRDALLARIALTPQHAEEPEPATTAVPGSGAGWGPRAWFALAASVAILVVLGFGAVTVGQIVNRPAAVVALDQIRSAPDAQSAQISLADGGVATAHWSAELGEVVLVADGLPEIGDDRVFEAWLINEEQGAVSAGLFAADAGDATTLLAGEYQPGDIIAVTVEPQGGAPDGVATGEAVIVIPTA